MGFDLNRLNDRELIQLGKNIHDNGKFGKDYVGMKKPEKIAYIQSELVRLYGETGDLDRITREFAQSILNARDENPQGEIEVASDCDAPASSSSKPADEDAQAKTQGGNADTEDPHAAHGQAKAPAQKDGEPTGGFGFDPQAGNAPQCPQGQNCPGNQGEECKHFPIKGKCECGADYANAKFHNNGEDHELVDCDVEKALREFHEPSANGKMQMPKPDPTQMDLMTLIRAVTHEEHDPTFDEVGKAFGKAEAAMHRVAEFAIDGAKNAHKALQIVSKMEIIQEKAKLQSPKLEIVFPDHAPVKIEGKHPRMMPRLMALCTLPVGLRVPIYIYGEAGCGKTTIAKHLAEYLGLDTETQFTAISGTADMTSGKINGWILPIDKGVYVPSQPVRMWEAKKGSLTLFDEFDIYPGEISSGIQTAVANGDFYVQEKAFAHEAPLVKLGPQDFLLAAGNTDLLGPTARYNARGQADGAMADRWLCLPMQTDPAVAAGMFGAEYDPLETWIPIQWSEDDLRDFLKNTAYPWYKHVERKTLQNRIPRIFSNRAAARIVAMTIAGFSWPETKKIALHGWTEDDLAQIGESQLAGMVAV